MYSYNEDIEVMLQFFRELLQGFRYEGMRDGFGSLDDYQNNPNHDLTIWHHTEAVARSVAGRGEVLVLAAILHDIGKTYLGARQFSGLHTTYHGHADASVTMADQVMRSLGIPTEVSGRVLRLIENHMRPHSLVDEATQSAMRRFVRNAGEDWRLAMELGIADAGGKRVPAVGYRDRYEALTARIEEDIANSAVVSPPRLVTGADIVAFGVPTGPEVGRLLRRLGVEIEANPGLSYEEAMEMVRQWRR